MRKVLVATVVVALFTGCDRSADDDASAPAGNGPAAAGQAREGVQKYAYLATDGGPHLLLPAALADNWTGAPNVRAVTDPRSDYGRAAAAVAKRQMAALPVGAGGSSGTALVFAEPPMTAWGTSADGLVEIYYLNQWNVDDLDALITAASAAIRTTAMQNTGIALVLREPDAFLLFAGDTPSNSAFGAHRIPIPAGSYQVVTAKHATPAGTVTLYRLKPGTP